MLVDVNGRKVELRAGTLRIVRGVQNGQRNDALDKYRDASTAPLDQFFRSTGQDVGSDRLCEFPRAGGETCRFRDIYAEWADPPAERTVREDLRLLRDLGLGASGGHGARARWWLSQKE